MRERKFWGWGYSDELLTDEEDKNIEQRILNNFSLSEVETIPIPKAKDIELHKSKISPPSSLQNLLSSDHLERLNHSYGKSFPDLARAMLGLFPNPPDLIAFPNNQDDIVSILDWADQNNIAVIPYGG